jgi:glycosyltransferase involved in cell wall biosynthesis
MNAASLGLIVFAFNESENIRPVLAELTRWLDEREPDHEILFVDDGSTDDTLAVAKSALSGRRAIFLRHDTNRGIGAAIKTGVAATTASWVTFMPADGQIEPDAIAVLRDAARDGQTDVVFSVYDHRNDGLDRKVFSLGIRGLILAVHGVWLHSDGPYLFRRNLFDPEQLKPDTFFLNFEFPIRALAAGLSAKTVTIRCRPRRAGNSKSTGLRRIWGVAKDLADLRVRRWRGL